MSVDFSVVLLEALVSFSEIQSILVSFTYKTKLQECLTDKKVGRNNAPY